MAKGKASNPADAARKAARARELKRNKEQRAKVREAATVKKDLRPMEADVRALQSKARSGGLSKAEQADLETLQSEIARIRKAKDDYVKANPEHRKFVYPHEHAQEEARAKEAAEAARARKEAAPGAPVVPAIMQGRVASRSIYYDAVFNPTGAPPPGMPYAEKPMEQWDDPEALSWKRAMGIGAGDEEEGEDSEDSDSDDDSIIMPEGPPPAAADSDSDEDGIVMPSGPPPAAIPTGPEGWQGPPLPPGPPPPHAFAPRPPMGMPGPSHGGFAPRPPPGLGRPPQMYAPRPPRGFFGRPGAQPAMQHTDPLAADRQATLTYQGWRARPGGAPGTSSASTSATTSATTSAPPSAPGPPPRPPPSVISAKPQLRDLRKEATAFVPAALRKKQAAAKAQASLSGLPGAVDAAPREEGGTIDATGGEEASAPRKVGLMEALGKHMGSGTTKKATGNDYDEFLDDVGDLL